mmetsp:Transcript_23084/g.66276  ORF Transcript_23084/g.66276 Transcript_23084/m.66276 type:complete len:316 (+) Transcript_23084:399-1346(+)
MAGRVPGIRGRAGALAVPVFALGRAEILRHCGPPPRRLFRRGHRCCGEPHRAAPRRVPRPLQLLAAAPRCWRRGRETGAGGRSELYGGGRPQVPCAEGAAGQNARGGGEGVPGQVRLPRSHPHRHVRAERNGRGGEALLRSDRERRGDPGHERVGRLGPNGRRAAQDLREGVHGRRRPRVGAQHGARHGCGHPLGDAAPWEVATREDPRHLHVPHRGRGPPGILPLSEGGARSGLHLVLLAATGSAQVHHGDDETGGRSSVEDLPNRGGADAWRSLEILRPRLRRLLPCVVRAIAHASAAMPLLPLTDGSANSFA